MDGPQGRGEGGETVGLDPQSTMRSRTRERLTISTHSRPRSNTPHSFIVDGGGVWYRRYYIVLRHGGMLTWQFVDGHGRYRSVGRPDVYLPTRRRLIVKLSNATIIMCQHAAKWSFGAVGSSKPSGDCSRVRALSIHRCTVVVLRVPRTHTVPRNHFSRDQVPGLKRRHGSQAKDADRQRKGQQKHHSARKRTQVDGKETRDESSPYRF